MDTNILLESIFTYKYFETYFVIKKYLKIIYRDSFPQLYMFTPR